MRTFEQDALLQIAMPMGGIGGGNICLTGNGALHDFSIRNRPATTALADGWGTKDSAFALVHVKGEKPLTLLAEGPMPKGMLYDRGLQAQGYRAGGFEGFPRFRNCRFTARYPFGTIELSDDDSPVDITLTGWSPFVPLDDHASGVPAAVLEYTLTNRSKKAVDLEFSFHASNWAACGAAPYSSARSKLIPGGVAMSNSSPAESEAFGSNALVTPATPRVKASWFRGGWFDAITKLWRECSSGAFAEAAPATEDEEGRHGASILVPASLPPGESVTVPIILTWHFPNSLINAGVLATAPIKTPIMWHPWYTTQWADAGAVAQYVRENLDALRSRTVAFADALHDSTLPPEVIDAVASNLAILKSPTVLRQASGNLWAWEGCFTTEGSCHGSCTHVWNYAQALPHLFPQLERTLREGELVRSMDERGHINFRSALPDGPTDHNYHAASDGQLGGVLKVWRDWQITGDRAWLTRMYPLIQRSLEFCRKSWDPDQQGMLIEPHHNTFDIEFWGPDGMCSSIYLGALTAMAAMALEMGEADYAAECSALAARGAKAMADTLFNGEYYQQQVRWTNLHDKTFVERLAQADLSKPAIAERTQLERVEGPKYQYGDGCLSDGVIGDWMTTLYGLPQVIDRDHIRQSLTAIHRHNFKSDLSRHVCLQRPGYALGDEGGVIVCSWPRGGQLTLPFPYSDEVWTGMEYQVASHLMLQGMVPQAMQIVRAARARYDGVTRNPFNEYECGSYYARALSSYALLQSLSGFRYSAAEKTLWFGPKSAERPFKCFFSAASGFGTIALDAEQLTITVIEGKLDVKTIHLTAGDTERSFTPGATAAPGKPLIIAIA